MLLVSKWIIGKAWRKYCIVGQDPYTFHTQTVRKKTLAQLYNSLMFFQFLSFPSAEKNMVPATPSVFCACFQHPQTPQLIPGKFVCPPRWGYCGCSYFISAATLIRISAIGVGAARLGECEAWNAWTCFFCSNSYWILIIIFLISCLFLLVFYILGVPSCVSEHLFVFVMLLNLTCIIYWVCSTVC